MVPYVKRPMLNLNGSLIPELYVFNSSKYATSDDSVLGYGVGDCGRLGGCTYCVCPNMLLETAVYWGRRLKVMKGWEAKFYETIPLKNQPKRKLQKF